jgi:hypothetical protein
MKFISKCENQVLTIKPNRQSVQDGIVIHVPGEHIRFQNGEFETTDKKEIEFIKNHRLYGNAITGVEDPNESDELEGLKKKADELGVEYSPNIGVKTLKERIEAAKQG